MDEREQAWPGLAAVAFDPASWDALQAAADRAGLSVAEYLREAVARPAAERPADAAPEEVQRALRSRLAAAARRSEARAVRAEADQAVRRAGAAARRSEDLLAAREAGLGNIAYVRALWAAFEAGGVAAMAALVPPDVRWRPLGAGGRVFRGTRELTEFWASRDAEMPALTMFHGRGDDVLVEAEYGRDDQRRRAIWLLYRFDGDRLVEAIGFSDEAQARGYRPPPAVR